MAGAFPNISGAYPVRFPYEHTLVIRTAVQTFWSGTSQRYAISGLLNSFKWNYRRINFSDLTTIETFWTAQKGAFDPTWSISLVDPTTKAIRSYANMAFDSDSFSYAESPAQWFAIGLDAVQTVSEAVTVALPIGSLPVLSNGAFVQIPFGTAPSFKTFRNDLDSGKRISWAAWPVPLGKWALSYPAITDAEVQTLINFYLAGGAVNPFSFVDPNTATTHSICYFGAQGIVLTRISPNVNSLTCAIEEFLT